MNYADAVNIKNRTLNNFFQEDLQHLAVSNFLSALFRPSQFTLCIFYKKMMLS